MRECRFGLSFLDILRGIMDTTNPLIGLLELAEDSLRKASDCSGRDFYKLADKIKATITAMGDASTRKARNTDDLQGVATSSTTSTLIVHTENDVICHIREALEWVSETGWCTDEAKFERIGWHLKTALAYAENYSEVSQREISLPFDEISIDVSTGDKDATLRAFAQMPPVEILENKGKKVALFEGYLNEKLPMREQREIPVDLMDCAAERSFQKREAGEIPVINKPFFGGCGWAGMEEDTITPEEYAAAVTKSKDGETNG